MRTHEKALANALQLQRRPRHGPSQSVGSVVVASSPTVSERPSTSSSTSSSFAGAFSFGALNFTSQNIKSAKMTLTPHHLFYLLSRFEEVLAVDVGPMKIRLENLHDTTSSANYVSFLSNTQRSKSRGSDVGSIHSVSSVRSVMSGISSLWSSFGIGASISAARCERQKAAAQADMTYLYSAFTKIPCLRLSPDWRARLIRGYEEFPFDSAVPLYAFKNLQALEISDLDYRQFFGWDRLSDQLRSLTLKRAYLEDPADVLIDIVLDDMDKRRRRSSKNQHSPTAPWGGSSSPKRSPSRNEMHKTTSAPNSPNPRKSVGDLRINPMSASENAIDDVSLQERRASAGQLDGGDEPPKSPTGSRQRSFSPVRRPSSRSAHVRSSHKVKRSGSGSSHSSLGDSWYHTRNSSTNLLSMGILPASKWRFLRHLSLADNSMTSIPASSLSPLANTLWALDLSANLFKEIPDSLATLTALRSLNLSHCMIDSLHSLTRNPLPAISTLNLRANRLQSLAGIEKLYPLERLDLRSNYLTDPMELARLTGIPDIREIWVDGNPFTRTHRSYRVTIFNLFRRTPGYTEDIVIDGSGPSYAEKRYLVERVPLPPTVPVVKPTPPPMPAVDVSKPTIIYDAPREPAVLRKERPTPKSASSEVNTSSTRRRKAPKRRIVDLATAESMGPPAQPQLPHPSHTGNGRKPSTEESTQASASDGNYRLSQTPETQLLPSPVLSESRQRSCKTPQLPEVPRIDGSLLPDLPPLYAAHDSSAGWKECQEWDSGEMYRRKIEALRDKVGNGYLSVLSEESWDASRPPDYNSSTYSPTIHASPTSNAAPVQAIHSGRTLG